MSLGFPLSTLWENLCCLGAAQILLVVAIMAGTTGNKSRRQVRRTACCPPSNLLQVLPPQSWGWGHPSILSPAVWGRDKVSSRLPAVSGHVLEKPTHPGLIIVTKRNLSFYSRSELDQTGFQHTDSLTLFSNVLSSENIISRTQRAPTLEQVPGKPG